MLGALLDSLRAAIAATTNTTCSVFIVDNDVDASARPVAERFRPLLPSLAYDIVPVRNIARARNRAMQLAVAAGADCIAFVDDDCTVAENWICELIAVAAASGADVVWGRRRFAVSQEASAWWRSGPLFPSAEHANGTRMETAESNNVLLMRRVAESNSFDERFGLAGGSDSLFFLRVRLAGGIIVWSNDAVVTETVPASRTSARWLLARAFRKGNCGVFVYKAALPLHRWLPGRVAKGIGHVALGGALALGGVVRGRGAILAGFERSAVGIGIIAALLGYRYVEYRNLHGG
jgi:succinoglycan biosynthesis protein ExoM